MSGDVVGDGEQHQRVEDSLELGALLARDERVIGCGSHGAEWSAFVDSVLDFLLVIPAVFGLGAKCDVDAENGNAYDGSKKALRSDFRHVAPWMAGVHSVLAPRLWGQRQLPFRCQPTGRSKPRRRIDV